MKLTFLGATGIVTGSCYLLETTKTKILIDCGMFQGTKDITRLNYESFNFDPKEISFMLLTHAHIDHSALNPKLVKMDLMEKSMQLLLPLILQNLCFKILHM